MTAIFTAISGQFNKAIFLGAFFPSAMFVLLALLFLGPLVPSDLSLLQPFQGLDTQWQAAVVLGSVVAMSALLFNFNRLIVRFYEGYPWQRTPLGRWLTGRHQRHLLALQAQAGGLRVLRSAVREGLPAAGALAPLPALPADDADRQAVIARMGEVLRELNEDWPETAGSVLPTRLGNVIRSYENYPRRQYQLSLITLWPRLQAVIDKDFAGTIDDAKTALDFMLNTSLLSVLLAVLLLYCGVLFGTGIERANIVAWIVEAATLFALGWFFYCLAIKRAALWGAQVKSAVDLYRWKLLDQLGYKKIPTDGPSERALWDNISQLLIYGSSPKVWPANYNAAAFAAGGPAGYVLPLEVTRGVTLMPAAAAGAPAGAITVHLRVCNLDAVYDAIDVSAWDTLPDGAALLWDSASRANPAGGARLAVQVSGIGPFRFAIGTVGHGEQVELTYQFVPAAK